MGWRIGTLVLTQHRQNGKGEGERRGPTGLTERKLFVFERDFNVGGFRCESHVWWVWRMIGSGLGTRLGSWGCIVVLVDPGATQRRVEDSKAQHCTSVALLGLRVMGYQLLANF